MGHKGKKIAVAPLFYDKFNFVVETRLMAQFEPIGEQNKLYKWIYKVKPVFDPLMGLKGVKIAVAPLFYEKFNFVVETRMMAHFVAIEEQNKVYKWTYKLKSIFDLPQWAIKGWKSSPLPHFMNKSTLL